MRSPVQTRFEELPAHLPIFPLSGALLLPWGRLPLNIFEPRYLNMTLDALMVGRIFGMIQPDPEKAPKNAPGTEKIPLEAEPALYQVGCAGRIASFEETEDGRLLILLKGLCRFRVVKEIDGRSGYRRVQAAYDAFKPDMDLPGKFDLDREKMLTYLKPYLESHSIPVNADLLKGLSDANLVTTLCMICPFNPREKQALLEADSISDRATVLIKLLQMGVFDASAAPDAPKQ